MACCIHLQAATEAFNTGSGSAGVCDRMEQYEQASQHPLCTSSIAPSYHYCIAPWLHPAYRPDMVSDRHMHVTCLLQADDDDLQRSSRSSALSVHSNLSRDCGSQ
jgi:hypothetical protein